MNIGCVNFLWNEVEHDEIRIKKKKFIYVYLKNWGKIVSQFFLKQKQLDLASEMLGYEEVKFNCTLSWSKDKGEAREAPRMQN